METYENEGTEKKFFTLTIGDETIRVKVCVYIQRLKNTLQVGKSYLFTKVSDYLYCTWSHVQS